MDSTTKKSLINLSAINVSYVSNRLSVIKIRDLYSVPAVTCMDNLSIPNIDRNMVNVISIPIENQVTGLELGRRNPRTAAPLAS